MAMSLMQCRREMAMNAYPVLCNNIIAMTGKGMMVLQNCLNSQKDVPGSHSVALASSSLDGVHAVNIKVEEFSDIEDEEDPVPMTAVGIKAEHEVSCMSLCLLLGIYCLHPEFVLFLICICHKNFSSLVKSEFLRSPF
jgi:hypothetical protein